MLVSYCKHLNFPVRLSFSLLVVVQGLEPICIDCQYEKKKNKIGTTFILDGPLKKYAKCS